jgi:hypothetical protein
MKSILQGKQGGGRRKNGEDEGHIELTVFFLVQNFFRSVYAILPSASCQQASPHVIFFSLFSQNFST